MNKISLQNDLLKLHNRKLEMELHSVKKESIINLSMYELQKQHYDELFNLMQDYILGIIEDSEIIEKVSKLDMKLESLMLEIIKEGELKNERNDSSTMF